VRVLICPDKFAGTLSAVQAAEAIAAGWAAEAPGDELIQRPLSDGGPGFVDVLAAPLDGTRVPVSSVDPLGRPLVAEILMAGDTAYVESAQVCGLHLLSPEERNPRITTSFGLGALLATAVESRARRVVLGLGGSGTNDAGAGFLTALGAPVLDDTGKALPYGGAALVAAASFGGTPATRDIEIVIATDVDNPLTGIHGASAVYGPQKGASREDVLLLDAALTRFAGVLETLPTCPPGVANLPGAGAAGGLGAALLALGGRVVPGIGLIRELTGFDAALDGADLVITGEGSFDAQSLRGKVISGVAAAARDRGLPCVVLAGRSSTGRREAAAAGVTDTYTLMGHFGNVDDALARPAEGLSALARRLAGQWSRT
jgi:glycerate kinase